MEVAVEELAQLGRALAASSEDGKELLRPCPRPRPAPPPRSRSRVWIPPQVTPIAWTPAAFAAACRTARRRRRRRRSAGTQPLERDEDRVRVRLVPLGVVGADDDVEASRRSRARRTRARRSRARFARDDPEPPPSPSARSSSSTIPGNASSSACSGSLCSRRRRELLDAVGRRTRHLLVEPRPPTRRDQLLVRERRGRARSASRAGRGEDDRAGVDQRAVEVEEDDRKTHTRSIVGGPKKNQYVTPTRIQPAREGPSGPPRRAAGPRAARDSAGRPLDHRPDECPHHVAQEPVGGDLEARGASPARASRPTRRRGRTSRAASPSA